jgi:hypothetical protein
MKLANMTNASPVIKKYDLNVGSIQIQFPGGGVWEYQTYDGAQLRNLIKKYRYKPGALANIIKQLAPDSKKIA